MLVYLIKRILLIIPTFFLISLVVFGIISIAPGLPGGVGSPAGSEESAADRVAQREGYALFRQQFNLDKPILFNSLFTLDAEEVRGWIVTVLNRNREFSQRDIIRADENLQNAALYSVPPLMEIISNPDEDRDVLLLALENLSINARRRPVGVYHPDPTPEMRELNREIDRENQVIRSQLTPTGRESIEELHTFAGRWQNWYEEHRNRWVWSAMDKVRIFFLDTRFARYWMQLFRLDFGVSLVFKAPVLSHIMSRLKYSLSLSVTSILITYMISIPIGIYSAVFQNSRSDRIITVVLFMLYSLPSFFVATLLLTTLSRGSDYLRIFPTGGFQSMNYREFTALQQVVDIMWHLFLPIVCLTYASFAQLSRYARSGLLEVIRSDYIRTARAKGLSEPVVIIKHAVRNGMIPIITLLGTLLPVIIGGSVIIETIFGIPGMGKLGYDAILNRDYNIIMGIQLISAMLVLIGITISDICYAVVDPRISFD